MMDYVVISDIHLGHDIYALPRPDSEANIANINKNLSRFIDRITYRLQWHPASVQPYINTPELTSPVDVHYVKDANGEVFTITPLPNQNTSRMIAGLQGESANGRTITAAGQYVMPFTMTVRLQ